MKVNLCCGEDKKKGWLNVDILDFGQEVVASINNKWTFLKDNSVDYIQIIDGLEHLDDVEHFLKECSRVLKVGGKVFIHTPHYKCPSAYKISHKHFFSWNSWADFPEKYDIVKYLEVVKLKIQTGIGLDFIANILPRYYEKFFYCMGVDVTLMKISKRSKLP